MVFSNRTVKWTYKYYIFAVDGGSPKRGDRISVTITFDASCESTGAVVPDAITGEVFFRAPGLTGSKYRKSLLHIFADLKDNKDSLHLGRKNAWIFVLRHYLFLIAHSFLRALLSENCPLLGTDNVCGQISEHIFAPNGDYCLFKFIHKLYDMPVLQYCNKELGSILSFCDLQLKIWSSANGNVNDDFRNNRPKCSRTLWTTRGLCELFIAGTSGHHSVMVYCNRSHGYDLCNIGTQHDIIHYRGYNKLTSFLTRDCDRKSWVAVADQVIQNTCK